jgi:hypothetical protein
LLIDFLLDSCVRLQSYISLAQRTAMISKDLEKFLNDIGGSSKGAKKSRTLIIKFMLSASLTVELAVNAHLHGYHVSII